MGIDCKKCINSGCCKLAIEVSRDEFHVLPENIKKHFVKYSEIFVANNPKHAGREHFFDEMYSENFALMNKSDDGLCPLLDRETMLCGVYDQRPQVCRDYTTNRCEQIRVLNVN